MALEAQENPFPYVTIEEVAVDGSETTPNPAADYRKLFLGEDGLLYTKDSAGTVALCGSSGPVATDAIWDAKGDLAAGTGANTASKLTVGSNDTILMADSAQSTGLKWVASQTPTTQDYDDAAAEGTADTYARGDHLHGMPSAGGGGAMVWLARVTASASATLDFASVISSTYEWYKINLLDITPATNATDLYFRVTTDNGSSYLSTNVYTYDHMVWRTGGVATSGNVTASGQMILSYNQAGADHISNATAGDQVSGELNIYTPPGANAFTFVSGRIIHRDSAGPFRVSTDVRGAYEAATNITGFRFLMSSGNITSGTIDVYGITHA